MRPYTELDASALREEVAAGHRSAVQTVEECFARIDALDAQLGVFLSTERALARSRAAQIDAQLARGEPAGPLCGVPVALKANMCLEGFEANCGSRMLAGWRAPYSATFAQRLLDAGAIPVGMTNMDEFAMGSSSENSAFHVSRNPWSREHTPGGSSSGSAVAVAAGLVPLAFGSDTGGSVRQPAALCGIHGFKPSWGRVSRYGLIAFGSSLDQVSPFARSTRDLELAMGVISGRDERDATCMDENALQPIVPDDERSLAGVSIGVPREYLPDSDTGEVAQCVRAALESLRALGAELREISLPHTAYAIPTYYVIATAEASSNLARYDGVRYGLRVEGSGSLQSMFAATRGAGFGAEVKRRILLGTYVLSEGYHDEWYGRALKVRTLVARDFEQAFEEVDLVAGPTSPTTAFRLGERAADPVAMYQADVLTVPASLAGLPAISTPCGFGAGTPRLPIGLQLVGPARSDARVLRVARAFEAATAHSKERPPLALEPAR
ncbi:MAG: Asp-tRNA(Asn)/Glu-tRNA(Gln) amidotransferase subunit GatA [Planctomycetes bacterium]|nr:Asp-tRNA(Asn)/Glu-tRNA(Gln) amidotransferase subunit GatA [Planctomycetota bacterium]